MVARDQHHALGAQAVLHRAVTWKPRNLAITSYEYLDITRGNKTQFVIMVSLTLTNVAKITEGEFPYHKRRFAVGWKDDGIAFLSFVSCMIYLSLVFTFA